MTRKIVLQLHRWLGLISGLVVFIVGITGAIYAFEKELRHFFHRDLYHVPAGTHKVGMDSLLAVASKALGKEYPVSRIEVDNDPGMTYGFYSGKYNNEATTYWRKVVYSKAVFVNPYTGAVVKVVDIKWEFFTVVLAIHRTLLLEHTGSLFIGWCTVVFIVLLISGFILWYPKNKAAARQRFWFRWKKTTTPKRKNYDLHNISGFYSMVLLLIIALTGLIWSFDWWEASVMKWVNGGKAVQFPRPVYSDTTQAATALSLTGIVSQVTDESMGRTKYFLVLPTEKKSTVQVVLPGSGRKRYQFMQLYFDRYSGKLISRGRLFKDKSAGEQLRNMNIDIHTGSILGWGGKLLACIISLIAALLPVTGFIIWWGKQKKSKGKPHKIQRAPVQGRQQGIEA